MTAYGGISTGDTVVGTNPTTFDDFRIAGVKGITRLAFETIFDVVRIVLLTTRDQFDDTSSVWKGFRVEEGLLTGCAVVRR